MGILAHVHHLHLTHLVYYPAAADVGIDHEDGIEHAVEHVFAAHQIDESLRVVEDTPAPVPAVALGEGAAPCRRIERSLESAVGFLAAHEVERVVEHVLIVHRVLIILLQLLVRFAQSLAESIYAPVVVSILESAGNALAVLVARHITKLVVFFKAKTAR